MELQLHYIFIFYFNKKTIFKCIAIIRNFTFDFLNFLHLLFNENSKKKISKSNFY